MHLYTPPGHDFFDEVPVIIFKASQCLYPHFPHHRMLSFKSLGCSDTSLNEETAHYDVHPGWVPCDTMILYPHIECIMTGMSRIYFLTWHLQAPVRDVDVVRSVLSWQVGHVVSNGDGCDVVRDVFAAGTGDGQSELSTTSLTSYYWGKQDILGLEMYRYINCVSMAVFEHTV